MLTIATLSLVVGPLVWLYLQQVTSTTFDFVSPSLTDPLWTSLHALLLTGAYPVVIWLAPFLFGLLLGRCQLGDRGFQHRLIGCSAAAALIPPGVSMALQTFNGPPTSEYGWDHLMTVEAHSQMPLWMISGCGTAGLIIGVFLRTEDWVTHRLNWLVSAGRLSLTIYVAHLFVLAWFVRPEPDTLLEGFLISTLMSAVFVVLAHLWRRHFGTGPLERLLRWPPSLKTQKSSGIK